MEPGLTIPETEDFNWMRYVQTELRLRQIKDELEAILKEVENRNSSAQPEPHQPPKRGWTRLFGENISKPRPASESASIDPLLVRKRLAEVEAGMVENNRELHSKLHQWLSLTDERYRLSAEIERRHHEIAEAIEPMPLQFQELRTRYGCARTEIGVAYEQETGTLSHTGQASVDRLVASYDNLIVSEERLVDRLNLLNKMLDGSIFVRLRLPEYRRAIPPDCRPGMPYGEMRANFEKGAEQINRVIYDLENYVLRLRRADYDREEILREYREAEWRRRLYLMAAA